MRHSCRGLLVLGMVAISGCSLLRPRPTTLGQTPVIQTAPVPAAAPLQTDLVPPPSWIYNDIACASFLTTQPSSTIRVVGSQDAVVKHLMATGDMLVIGGGANDGIQPGQRFFVRRFIRTFGATKGPDPLHPLSVHTSGWVQILGVDATVSTATVLHACEGILLDDYLEPFTEPMIAAHAVPGSTPQYTNMGHILTSDELFQNVASVGQMISIDRGSDVGVVLGQRYLVFRDKRKMRNEGPDYSKEFALSAPNIPLVEVGEVLVVAVRRDQATVEVVMAKDVITTGDLIAEIR